MCSLNNSVPQYKLFQKGKNYIRLYQLDWLTSEILLWQYVPKVPQQQLYTTNYIAAWNTEWNKCQHIRIYCRAVTSGCCFLIDSSVTLLRGGAASAISQCSNIHRGALKLYNGYKWDILSSESREAMSMSDDSGTAYYSWIPSRWWTRTKQKSLIIPLNSLKWLLFHHPHWTTLNISICK